MWRGSQYTEQMQLFIFFPPYLCKWDLMDRRLHTDVVCSSGTLHFAHSFQDFFFYAAATSTVARNVRNLQLNKWVKIDQHVKPLIALTCDVVLDHDGLLSQVLRHHCAKPAKNKDFKNIVIKMLIVSWLLSRYHVLIYKSCFTCLGAGQQSITSRNFCTHR